MENKRIANIANARRYNQDEYEKSIHEPAYWKRRELIEKKSYSHSASASMKLKNSKEKTQGDTVEIVKEELIIPQKQAMSAQMRVEKGKHVAKLEEKQER